MYQITKMIGRGANGDVFLARKKEDNSIQVIKKLKIRDISDRERQTIQTQLRLLKEFKHVNIVPFRDSFIDNQGNLNIVMGYCEGGDMHILIEDSAGKKFQEKKIIQWIVQLALSIFYLHEKRVLHRDIKTQNIFLTNGKIMLGDFGVSKVLDQAVDLAVTNIGTPYYMSPEQYRQKPYSYKSDIWAFGCIIYEMCSHKHVFEALSLQGLAIKVLKGIYAPISEEYSKQLRALVTEMLKQNPKDRPSIREILVRPFLFGKVQNYMKKIYSEKDKYEPQMIKSLQNQAASLGFSLQQPKPKKIQPTAQQTQKKQRTQSKKEQTKQKQKEQNNKKYQKLNQALKKQIQQRNRAQEQLKRLQKQKNQKKRSTEKYSVQKPKTKSEIAKSERSTNSTNTSRTKIKVQEGHSVGKASEDRERERERERERDRDERERKEERKQERKDGIGKNFRIEEDYDMDYEEYSDKEDNDINKIYEEDDEDEEDKPIHKVRPQKQQRIQNNQKVVEKDKQSEKVTEKMTQKEKVSEKVIEKEKQGEKQRKAEKQKQTEKQKSVNPQQQQQQQQIPKQDQLQRQVKQKTSLISNIRNEISKLDFVISSDSQLSQKEERTYNPAYTKITQKINDLKQKVITIIGRNGYPTLLDYLRGNYGKADRTKAVMMVGEDNIGVWHLAENIVRFQRILVKVPVYLG